jgi:cytochrome c biogenesis protein
MPSTTARILLRFLGSMNLAITLLVAIAIAAVIGTVVQQNQPYPDYVLKFGPFWFQLFKQLDLFNVYGSAWFLTILGFLVVSTSVCVSRNMPQMLRDMRDYHENSPRAVLQNLPHRAEIRSPQPVETNLPLLHTLLNQHGYAVKSLPYQNGWRLAAKTGSGGRLGYLFSHIAIVVICIGGLIDGNLPLKWAEWRGHIAVETRRIPAADIPAISTLSSDNASFRANVDIAEGGQANLAFIDYKDGYLLQKGLIPLTDLEIKKVADEVTKSF